MTPLVDRMTTPFPPPPFQGNPDLMQQMQQGPAGQILQNPQLMAQMMQNPLIQQSMEQMLSNPELMQQMMASNPLFANNPEMVCHSVTLHYTCY